MIDLATESSVSSAPKIQDQNLLLSVGSDCQIHWYDLETKQTQDTSLALPASLFDIVRVDSSLIAVSSYRSSMGFIVNLRSNSVFGRVVGHSKALERMAIFPKFQNEQEQSENIRLMTASDDGTIRVCKSFIFADLKFRRHQAPIYPIKTHHRVLLSGSDDHSICVWAIERNFELQEHRANAHDENIVALTTSPDTALFTSVSRDGICKVWNATNLARPIREIHVGVPSFSIEYLSPHQVVVGRKDGKCDQFDLRRLKQGPLQSIRVHDSRCTVWAFARVSGGRIVSAADRREVVLWSLKTGRVVHRFARSSPYNYGLLHVRDRSRSRVACPAEAEETTAQQFDLQERVRVLEETVGKLVEAVQDIRNGLDDESQDD